MVSNNFKVYESFKVSQIVFLFTFNYFLNHIQNFEKIFSRNLFMPSYKRMGWRLDITDENELYFKTCYFILCKFELYFIFVCLIDLYNKL